MVHPPLLPLIITSPTLNRPNSSLIMIRSALYQVPKFRVTVQIGRLRHMI